MGIIKPLKTRGVGDIIIGNSNGREGGHLGR